MNMCLYKLKTASGALSGLSAVCCLTHLGRASRSPVISFGSLAARVAHVPRCGIAVKPRWADRIRWSLVWSPLYGFGMISTLHDGHAPFTRSYATTTSTYLWSSWFSSSWSPAHMVFRLLSFQKYVPTRPVVVLCWHLSSGRTLLSCDGTPWCSSKSLSECSIMGLSYG